MAVTNNVFTGKLSIKTTDFKYIKWVGNTKDGHAVKIEISPAICKSNIEFTFAEKDDVVPEIEFEGVYDDTKLAANDRTEPWTITIDKATAAGNGEIVLGAGKFYIGTSESDAKCVGLTRGGGSFTLERTFREINADDDPGAVKDRLDITESRPKLKMKVLQFITKVGDIYAGIEAKAGA